MLRFPPHSFPELILEAQKFAVAAESIMARHKHRDKRNVIEVDKRPLARNQNDICRERNDRDDNGRCP